jgi:hypothetical protein
MRLTVTTDGSADSAETARQLEAADQALRQSFSGFELDAVVGEVRRSLDEIGLPLTGDEVQAYARAIRDREDHEITVR